MQMPIAAHIDLLNSLDELTAHLMTRAYLRQDGTLAKLCEKLEADRVSGLSFEDRYMQAVGQGYQHRLGHSRNTAEVALGLLSRFRKKEIKLSPFNASVVPNGRESHSTSIHSTDFLNEIPPAQNFNANEPKKTQYSVEKLTYSASQKVDDSAVGVLPYPSSIPSALDGIRCSYAPEWELPDNPIQEHEIALLDELECTPAAINVSFLNTTSLTLSHKRRKTSDLTAHDVAHIQLAMRAAEQKGRPLNAAILVRLDLSTAYREHWDGSAQREPRTNAEHAARERAREAATDKLARTLNNFRRPLGAPLSFIQVLECPQAGGAGLHAHILCHLPNQAAAEIILRAVSRLFDGGEQLLADYRQDPGKLDNAISTHKLPFDLRGEASFIRHPESRFMSSSRRWGTAAYFCKSAAQDISVTIGGQQLTLAQIRPEKDEDGHLRALQNIRSYQPQVPQMGITRRLRFSRDLDWKSLEAQGLTLHDAEDAGWLSKTERGRRKGLAR